MEDKKRFYKRCAWLFIFFAFFVSALVGRLVYLQLWSKARYANLARAQRIQPTLIDPQRGNIYDRNYELLAKSVDAYSIHVIPSKDRNHRDRTESEITIHTSSTDFNLKKYGSTIVSV